MKKILLLSLLLIVFLEACSGSHRPPERPHPHERDESATRAPQSKGKTIGREFIQGALHQFTFVKDVEVIREVRRVANNILEAIGEDPEEYHFFVVKENQLNAFAVPGGYIFLYEGLLKQLKTESALAGVLAHEIAHVKRRHFFKDASKRTAVDIATLASIILASIVGNDAGAASVIGTAVNTSFKLQFSRANEEDADLQAIKYLKQSRYHPEGLSEFFATLAFYSSFTRGVPPPYLSTHPGLVDRKRMVDSLISTGFRPEPLDVNALPWWQDWSRIVTILRASGGEGPTEADLQVKGGGSDQGFEPSRVSYLQGLSAFRLGKLQEALIFYQKAIKAQPGIAIYHADLARIYMGLQAAAEARLSALESIRLLDDNAGPHLVLGMIAQSELDHEGAIVAFHRALVLSPNDGFVHLQLARSYNVLKKTGPEWFHLGRYHRENLEPWQAHILFEKALEVLKSESLLAIKVRDELAGLERDGV